MLSHDESAPFILQKGFFRMPKEVFLQNETHQTA